MVNEVTNETPTIEADAVAEAKVEDENEVISVAAEEFNALKAEVERLKAHHEKVTKEKKEEIAKAERQKAEAEGDYKKLLEMKDNEIQERENVINQYKTKEQQQILNSAALELAQSLAKTDPRKARQLQKEFLSRMKLSDEGEVRVTDEKGNVISDKLDTLAVWAKKDLDFLCDGLQSTGSVGVQIKPEPAKHVSTNPIDTLMRLNS